MRNTTRIQKDPPGKICRVRGFQTVNDGGKFWLQASLLGKICRDGGIKLRPSLLPDDAPRL
jgi:hypothetical protein